MVIHVFRMNSDFYLERHINDLNHPVPLYFVGSGLLLDDHLSRSAGVNPLRVMLLIPCS